MPNPFRAADVIANDFLAKVPECSSEIVHTSEQCLQIDKWYDNFRACLFGLSSCLAGLYHFLVCSACREGGGRNSYPQKFELYTAHGQKWC